MPVSKVVNRVLDAAAIAAFLGAVAFTGWRATKGTPAASVGSPIYQIDEPLLFVRDSTVVPKDKVVVVEYSDFRCVYCQLATKTIDSFVAKHAGSIHFQYRHIALQPESVAAAIAAECGAAQGRDHAMRTALFAKADSIGDKSMTEYAITAQIPDIATFNRCMESERARAIVVADTKRARSVGITQTPTFIVGTTVFVGNPGAAALDSAFLAARSDFIAQARK